jgi:hypothetical protein
LGQVVSKGNEEKTPETCWEGCHQGDRRSPNTPFISGEGRVGFGRYPKTMVEGKGKGSSQDYTNALVSRVGERRQLRWASLGVFSHWGRERIQKEWKMSLPLTEGRRWKEGVRTQPGRGYAGKECHLLSWCWRWKKESSSELEYHFPIVVGKKDTIQSRGNKSPVALVVCRNKLGEGVFAGSPGRLLMGEKGGKEKNPEKRIFDREFPHGQTTY